MSNLVTGICVAAAIASVILILAAIITVVVVIPHKLDEIKHELKRRR